MIEKRLVNQQHLTGKTKKIKNLKNASFKLHAYKQAIQKPNQSNRPLTDLNSLITQFINRFLEVQPLTPNLKEKEAIVISCQSFFVSLGDINRAFNNWQPPYSLRQGGHPLPAHYKDLAHYLFSFDNCDPSVFARTLRVYNELFNSASSNTSLEVNEFNGRLSALLECTNLKPYYISLVTFSLGRLKENGQLNGTLSIDLAKNLFNTFSKLITTALNKTDKNEKIYQLPNIPKMIHGMGTLALKGGFDPNYFIKAKQFNQLFNQLIQLIEIDHSSRLIQINMALVGAARAAQSGYLQGFIKNEHITRMLNISIRTLKQSEQTAKPHTILDNMLWSIGWLADKAHLSQPIDASTIQTMLDLLINSALKALNMGAGINSKRDQQHCLDNLRQIANSLDANKAFVKAYHFSKSLYGIGRMSKNVQGQIKASTIEMMLRCLLAFRANVMDQNYSNSVYGVGLLASRGCIEGQINSDCLNNVCDALANCSQKPSPQKYVNCLYGTALLADSHCIEGKIKLKGINQLLSQLTAHRDVQIYALSPAIYSLGRLVISEKIQGVVDKDQFSNLLNALKGCRSEASERHLSDLFNGIGKLSDSLHFQGHVSVGFINALLNQLMEKVQNPKEVAILTLTNSLYGITRLVKSGRLNGSIDLQPVKAIIDQFLNLKGQADPKLIAGFTFELGSLDLALNLSEGIDAHEIEALINQLLSKKAALNHVELTCSLSGLASLLLNNVFSNSISDELIQTLVAETLGIFEKELNNKKTLGSMKSCFLNSIQWISVINQLGYRLTPAVANSYHTLTGTMLEPYLNPTPSGQSFALDKKDAFQLAKSLCYMGERLPKKLQEQLKQHTPEPNQKQKQLVAQLQQKCYSDLLASITAEALIGAHFVDIAIQDVHGQVFIVELDGSQHYDAIGQLDVHDKLRDQWLKNQGYRVIRYKNNEIHETGYLKIAEAIVETIKAKQPFNAKSEVTSANTAQNQRPEKNQTAESGTNINQTSEQQHASSKRIPGHFKRNARLTIKKRLREEGAILKQDSFFRDKQPSFHDNECSACKIS